MKAQVNKRSLVVTVADNLPTAAVDKISIIEVVNNLVDNAIKYSKEGEAILIDAHMSREGYIETTVKDHGVGIPANVVNNLFSRFYRNHRTATTVGGTGLGLFLSKAIVNAHGGEIWVQSKEGEGSTFGFTLLPASRLAEQLKSGNNSGIVRNAHGWIKNHSLTRR
jgi:signal transduction histidine kinase